MNTGGGEGRRAITLTSSERGSSGPSRERMHLVLSHPSGKHNTHTWDRAERCGQKTHDLVITQKEQLKSQEYQINIINGAGLGGAPRGVCLQEA